jgi:hypothetical protein
MALLIVAQPIQALCELFAKANSVVTSYFEEAYTEGLSRD